MSEDHGTTPGSASGAFTSGDRAGEGAEQKNPFVPGARVAISDGWDNWHEGFVEKAYKTGRFTLKGNTQQWRPEEPRHYCTYWSAHQTGNGWSRASLRIWDEQADIEIKEIFAKQARKQLWANLLKRMERVREGDLTDAMLDQIAAALPSKPTPTFDDRTEGKLNGGLS